MSRIFRDGDIFRWRYTQDRESKIKQFSCDPYWSKSCIAVFGNGRLFDTFWHGGDNINWTPQEAEAELELTYVGNFSELTKASEYMAEYYDNSDYVNLNHGNSPKGNFYLRTGAKRSQKKMLEVAVYKLDKAKGEMSSAKRDVDRYGDLVERIERGDAIDEIYL